MAMKCMKQFDTFMAKEYAAEGKVSRDTVAEEDNFDDSFNNEAVMDWQAYVGTGKA